ncbi:MAG: pantoate kinase [Candidatus Bathyarchaeia archaeon]
MKVAKAFAPGAISSFFEIHDTEDGTPLADPLKMGAIGGGFGLQKGTSTTVSVEEAVENSISVRINGESVNAKVTKQITEALLLETTRKYAVAVEHQIEVPIGMGFGTSAGGALTTGLALKEALSLPLTYNQIGQAAHIAEIHCQTGLGTVSSLNFGGGLILVTEPGAPGICQTDRIPIPPDYVVVAGFYRSLIPKKSVLSSPEKKAEINRYGRKTLEAILAEPSLENFLEQCWAFSQKAGFANENITALVDAGKRAGAVGAAQNMIGEAVHAVVHEENALSVAEAFKKTLPQNQVLISKIDFQGARLIK